MRALIGSRSFPMDHTIGTAGLAAMMKLNRAIRFWPPGVDENSVDITLENNVLTINGYVEPVQPEGHRLAYAEYQVGDYQRAFTLSDQIDRAGIEAVVKDGVLRLHLPKVAEAQKRKIAIRAG